MKNKLSATNRTPDNQTGTPFTSPHHLSDDAFYLIVLASLLKKTIEPGALKQLLIPGKFVGYGAACNNEELLFNE